MAISGNYLAFRWNYPTEEARKTWLDSAKLAEGDDAPGLKETVAIPSAGVFAEAVLGRSNAAEKLDITRFWNWQDSPIPILPPEISPLSAGSRARDLEMQRRGFDQVAAQLAQFGSLPDPTGLRAAVDTATADIFRDMSAASDTLKATQQAIITAAKNEEAAGQAPWKRIRRPCNTTRR